jgi:hemerythrin
MNATAWEEKYRLGVDAIDAQHRQLFDLIGEMNRLIAAHAGAGEIQAVLKRFQRWAEMHFAAEETRLAVTGYPGREAHILEHTAFLDTIEKNIKLISSRPLSVTETKISRLLTNWLQGHILENDRNYLPHLKASIKGKA